MKEIPLTQGFVALVDDEDYEELAKHKWTSAVRKYTVYAVRYTMESGVRSVIYMHRVITNAVPGMKVDHKNGNGLDNQRHNIRECNDKQNQQNRYPSGGCSSTHKGVCWQINRHTWNAYITINHRRIHLGVFACEGEAANAYALAATHFFGEFANV